MDTPLSTLRIDIRESPSNSTLQIELWIDGQVFGSDLVDISELRKSAMTSGGYYILTCGCGEPGCAGYFAPIGVAHIDDRVVWECDDRFYPVPERGATARPARFLVYEFDRQQYIDTIRWILSTLREHPQREVADIGPHGFDKKTLDLPLPEATSRALPFRQGAKLIVGYIGEYEQPWVWIEEDREIPARQLLPTMTLWHKFGYWASMWDSPSDLGVCTWKKDGMPFQPEPGVTSEICNQAVEDLARELQLFWGKAVTIEVEDVEIQRDESA